MSETMATSSRSDVIRKTETIVSDLSIDSASFACKFCSKTFPKKPALNRHKRLCSLNGSAKNMTIASCEICGRPFNRTDNLKKHIKNCSTSVTKNKQMKKRSCLYVNCEANFYQKEALIQHLTNNHGHNFEERSQLRFHSYRDFEEWKEAIEAETHSYFIKINGKKGAVQYFYCQQDGEPDKTVRKTNRRNAKGKIKTGKTCIAYIKLIEKLQENCYDVIFQPMHCHLLRARDKKHHPLSKRVHSLKANEFSMNSTPKKVAVKIKSSMPIELTKFVDTSSASQEQESTIVDTDSIVFSCGLTEDLSPQDSLKISRRSDDETAVINIVQNYLNEADSPIILYKSNNPDVYIGPEEFEDSAVPADTFILGIQTKEQREMFISGCQVLLSLDTSHINTESDYQILNLVVPDEKAHEYPVGHLITNSLNSSVIAIFFYSVLSRCLDVTINCILSNNDPELNEAIHSVFGNTVRHIFCTWRLYKDFQQHLEICSPTELQDEMFSALDALVHADDEITAENMLQNFKKTYVKISPNFIEFLSKYYADVLHKWVMCFRNFDYADINTVMLSEANHNKLLSFTKRKLEWNLEDFVNLLLELEEDDYLRRANEQILGVSFSLSDPENSRHEEGLQISDSSVSHLFQNHWEVKSQKKDNKYYLVVQVREKCFAELCYNTCHQCNKLCGHMFYCTCIDKNPMCKHIHKVHLSLIHSIEDVKEVIESVIPSDPLEITTSVELEIVPLERSYVLQDVCKNSKTIEIENCLSKLSNLLVEGDTSVPLLKHVDKTLQELINIGQALV